MLKYIVVFAGNAIDVMLTYDHDRQFISIYTSPSVAGQFSHARAKPLLILALTHRTLGFAESRSKTVATEHRTYIFEAYSQIHFRAVQGAKLCTPKMMTLG